MENRAILVLALIAVLLLGFQTIKTETVRSNAKKWDDCAKTCRHDFGAEQNPSVWEIPDYRECQRACGEYPLEMVGC